MNEEGFDNEIATKPRHGASPLAQSDKVVRVPVQISTYVLGEVFIVSIS